MKRYSTILFLSAWAMMTVAGCQKSDLNDSAIHDSQTSMVSFSPMVKGMATVSGLSTKGALINGGDDASGVKPLEELLGESELADFSFYVAAWDVKITEETTVKTQFIPPFDKVKYFTTVLNPAEEDEKKQIHRNMWNTVKSGDDTQILERMWESEMKSGKDKASGVTKEFIAYANVPTGTTAEIVLEGDQPKSLKLTYIQPEEESAQKDVLVGYYKGDGQQEGKLSGTASITFQHPLSSVQLVLGTITGVKVFTINSIRIEDVYAGGVFTMTPKAKAAGVDCAWEINTDPGSGKPVLTTVTQDINLLIKGTDPSAAVGANTAIGKPFIVLPQDFEVNGARVIVNVTADGKNLDLGWNLDPATWKEGAVYSDEWKSGITYTYALNYNGHAGVQLWSDGPYWATRNVGAKKIEDSGLYFSWGNVKGYVPTIVDIIAGTDYNCIWTWTNPETHETETFNDYVGFFEDGYYYTGKGSQGKGSSLSKNIPSFVDDGTVYDAALDQMGTKWRMPTKDEMDKLIDSNYTEIKYWDRNGVEGFLVTGVQEGYKNKSIFFPASGFGAGSKGTPKISFAKNMYWTGTYSNTNQAYCLELSTTIEKGGVVKAVPSVHEFERYLGMVIRAVENTN